METKDVILQLRIQNGWTQEELAEKLCVTREKPRQIQRP